jgi:hypothetical protein
MDSSQGYVKLRFVPFTPNPNPVQPSTIQFFAPADGQIPPGWYMLTVVNAEGLPSVAKWVLVVRP